MRGKAITGDERKVLMHVATVLLTMANLAERAAYLSLPVRWLSLWALWRARHAVEAFLSGTGSEVLTRPHGSMPLRRGYSSVDAFGLAAALRLLAFALRRHTERLARPWLTWKVEVAAKRKADPEPAVARLLHAEHRLGPARPFTCDTS